MSVSGKMLYNKKREREKSRKDKEGYQMSSSLTRGRVHKREKQTDDGKGESWEGRGGIYARSDGGGGEEKGGKGKRTTANGIRNSQIGKHCTVR